MVKNNHTILYLLTLMRESIPDLLHSLYLQQRHWGIAPTVEKFLPVYTVISPSQRGTYEVTWSQEKVCIYHHQFLTHEKYPYPYIYPYFHVVTKVKSYHYVKVSAREKGVLQNRMKCHTLRSEFNRIWMESSHSENERKGNRWKGRGEQTKCKLRWKYVRSQEMLVQMSVIEEVCRLVFQL